MDAQTLLKQIGKGNLMAVGARDFVRDGRQLMFRVGSSRKLAKVIVTLTPADEFTVRYVEMSRTDYSILVDETRDAFCDNVGEVVREMGDR
ncbi:MAG: hypothetical protein EPN91_08710 [Salinibacterium sp.]|nr:MAG: hypothetical protein EPN91_08710 [Salinibacterium sp.]